MNIDIDPIQSLDIGMARVKNCKKRIGDYLLSANHQILLECKALALNIKNSISHNSGSECLTFDRQSSLPCHQWIEVPSAIPLMPPILVLFQLLLSQLVEAVLVVPWCVVFAVVSQLLLLVEYWCFHDVFDLEALVQLP